MEAEDRRRRWPFVVLAVVIAVLAIAAILRPDRESGARAAHSTATTTNPRPRFEFFESVSAPLPREGRGVGFDAAMVTLPVVNHGAKARVTAIRPEADKGLGVDYLGRVDCARAPCPGGSAADAETLRYLHKSLVGRLPLVLEHDARVDLIFALKVEPDGLATFQQRCLRFRSVEFTLDNGSRHLVRYGRDGTLGDLHVSPLPPDYAVCQSIPTN
jgi:hypothetical protein